MTDEQIEHMAKVLRAIVDIPLADRMTLLGQALNVAICEGMLTREVDLKLLLRQRFNVPAKG